MAIEYNGFSERIARRSLQIGGIKLRPEQPFQWASGFFMPIYNDNRLLLFDPQDRLMVAHALNNALTQTNYNDETVIAGTSTAGISPGTTLANLKNSPFIYVRPEPKDHGLRNRIEGLSEDKDLEGRTTILVEDLVSTGGSSVSAVQGVRDANGKISFCISIFSYGLPKATAMFAGTEAYDKNGNKLAEPCTLVPVLTYNRLLQIALDDKKITSEQLKMLEEWREDPFGWGEKHGFPQVKK